VQPRERAQQGGLAAAVGADQSGDPPGPQPDVGAVHHRTVVVAEVQADAVEAVRAGSHDTRHAAAVAASPSTAADSCGTSPSSRYGMLSGVTNENALPSVSFSFRNTARPCVATSSRL
jgi:hypothetical protein